MSQASEVLGGLIMVVVAYVREVWRWVMNGGK